MWENKVRSKDRWQNWIYSLIERRDMSIKLTGHIDMQRADFFFK
jgi:hypothetical protein